MAPSTMNDLFSFLTQLMTEHASLFEGMGAQMFRGFAVILIAWFGIKSALASASGGIAPGFHFDRFADLLVTIAFGFAMISFYSRPIPGMGVSFYHLIIDQGLTLANQLNHSLVQDIWDRLNGLYWGLEVPGLTLAFNLLEGVRYLVTVLCLLVAEAAVFAVIAFGYVAAAIAVLLGPIFIPFFIVPHLEWLFWGWLKSLIQYAFYPVVANAYLFVFGNLLIRFVDAHPAPYDGAMLLVLFFPLVLLLIAFSYGVLRIPSLVNSLFTGRSGEAAVPRLW
ncbi:MAG TPA: type IV secretion system protein [Vicinamibacterales bacterium]|jgi:type IV secretory pathway VirB6-like protein|nr:type IV secretion system protein [Vicinamibacterales bacterium]